MVSGRARDLARFLGAPTLAGLVLAAGCGKTPHPEEPLAADPAGRLPGAAPAPTEASAPPRVTWENPGGMWMPEQLVQKKDELAKLGFAVPAEKLADPTQFPLGAVVWLGGCSASFVSAVCRQACGKKSATPLSRRTSMRSEPSSS